MKLIQLEITSFGKLRDFSLSFEEGFEPLIHPNEFGKTTLIRFIYFMLFGYEAKKLKEYFPWDGSPLAGALTLESCGSLWRIERIHPQKGAEKRKVFCPQTGKDAPLSAKEQPASLFLKMDGETFLKTLCITESDLLFSRTDGLDTALKNLAGTGDENISYSQAEGYLRDLHKQYMHWGKTQGPLLELKKELENDRLRLSELKQQVERGLITKSQWEGLERELLARRAEEEALKMRFEQAKASDALKTLKKLEQLRAQKPKEKPAVSQEDLSAIALAFENQKKAAEQAQTASEEEAHMQDQAAILRASLEHFGFHSLSASQIERVQNPSRLPLILSFIFGLLGLGLLGLGLWKETLLGLILGSFGLLLAIGILLANALERNRICRMNGAMNPTQLLEKWEQYQKAQRKREETEALLKEAILKKQTADAAWAFAQEQVEALRLRHRIFNEQELQDARIQWGIYLQGNGQSKALQEQLLLGDRKEEEYRLLAQGATELEETAEQVRHLLFDLQEQITSLSQQKDALDLSDLKGLWEEQQHLLQEIERKRIQVQKGQEALFAIQKSLLWLQESNEQMSAHFAPRLCKKAGALLKEITDGKYENLLMDEKFNICLTTREGTYPLSSFSSGTRDAVYLSFRIAAGESLSEEALPLLLDDPFVHLDDQRKEAALSLLKKAASSRQILYFSCRE